MNDYLAHSADDLTNSPRDFPARDASRIILVSPRYVAVYPFQSESNIVRVTPVATSPGGKSIHSSLHEAWILRCWLTLGPNLPILDTRRLVVMAGPVTFHNILT